MFSDFEARIAAMERELKDSKQEIVHVRSSNDQERDHLQEEVGFTLHRI